MDDAPPREAPETTPSPLQFPTRTRSLRLLAQARRLAMTVLPLGAGIGLVTALALSGLEHVERAIQGTHLRALGMVALPLVGLVLTGLWLRYSRLGEVSLARDVAHSRLRPLEVFSPLSSLGKALACALTIGFGGSAGIEGPAKWLGAATGAEFHRLLRMLARRVPQARRLVAQASVMVNAGAAAGLAAVFRAPLSGALLAVEHGGDLRASELAPALAASASGYLACIALRGAEPLFGTAGSYHLVAREIYWAMPLGLACALAASLFRRLLRFGRHHLGRYSLPVRGSLAGLGLVLLALPGAWFWPNLPITQGGGIDLVLLLLKGGTPSGTALLFLALKLAATALTFAGGGVGGTWLPSVAMGAALGAAFEGWAGFGQPGLFVMVGASAFAGAVHRTLLTPVVFLAETTGQSALVVPALVATVAAFQATRAD